jgi:hypothetical protein
MYRFGSYCTLILSSFYINLYCFVRLKMSNYHHTQIARLEDISHPPLIVNPTNNIRKHVQGYVTLYIS